MTRVGRKMSSTPIKATSPGKGKGSKKLKKSPKKTKKTSAEDSSPSTKESNEKELKEMAEAVEAERKRLEQLRLDEEQLAENQRDVVMLRQLLESIANRSLTLLQTEREERREKESSYLPDVLINHQLEMFLYDIEENGETDPRKLLDQCELIIAVIAEVEAELEDCVLPECPGHHLSQSGGVCTRAYLTQALGKLRVLLFNQIHRLSSLVLHQPKEFYQAETLTTRAFLQTENIKLFLLASSSPGNSESEATAAIPEAGIELEVCKGVARYPFALQIVLLSSVAMGTSHVSSAEKYDWDRLRAERDHHDEGDQAEVSSAPSLRGWRPVQPPWILINLWDLPPQKIFRRLGTAQPKWPNSLNLFTLPCNTRASESTNHGEEKPSVVKLIFKGWKPASPQATVECLRLEENTKLWTTAGVSCCYDNSQEKLTVMLSSLGLIAVTWIAESLFPLDFWQSRPYTSADGVSRMIQLRTRTYDICFLVKGHFVSISSCQGIDVSDLISRWMRPRQLVQALVTFGLDLIGSQEVESTQVWSIEKTVYIQMAILSLEYCFSCLDQQQKVGTITFKAEPRLESAQAGSFFKVCVDDRMCKSTEFIHTLASDQKLKSKVSPCLIGCLRDSPEDGQVWELLQQDLRGLVTMYRMLALLGLLRRTGMPPCRSPTEEAEYAEELAEGVARLSIG